MRRERLGTWLRRLRGTAEFVYIAALCVAVAVLVISLIPRSPVTLELPTAVLTGLDGVGGVVAGVTADPKGAVVFTIADPSLAQRLLSNVASWSLSATMLSSGTAAEPHRSPLGWLAVGLIFAAFAQLITRGVALRAELDTVI